MKRELNLPLPGELQTDDLVRVNHEGKEMEGLIWLAHIHHDDITFDVVAFPEGYKPEIDVDDQKTIVVSGLWAEDMKLIQQSGPRPLNHYWRKLADTAQQYADDQEKRLYTEQYANKVYHGTIQSLIEQNKRLMSDLAICQAKLSHP